MLKVEYWSATEGRKVAPLTDLPLRRSQVMNSMNSNSPLPAVGIDLGTTYSVVSALDEQGIPRSLPNAEGDLLTPSAVLS